MHICIVRLSAIGDVVMLVPLVRTLQAQLPEVKITWVISKGAHSLLAGLSGVEFVVIDKPCTVMDYWRFKKQMCAYHFDVLLALQASFRANWLYLCIRAKRKIGFDKKRAKDGHRFFINESIFFRKEHLLEGFLQFAEKLGIEKKCLSWNLPIGEKEIAHAKTICKKKPCIAINPKASKKERNWLFDNYVALIEQIKKMPQVQVILTGSVDDSTFCEQIAKKTGVCNLAGKTTLKELAAILAEVDCLIAPDTGPVHIATAVGTKVIGLYAVAPSALSGPYLSKKWVIDKYDLAVKKILKANPETIAWGTRVHTQKAMALITVDEVLAKLKWLLNS